MITALVIAGVLLAFGCGPEKPQGERGTAPTSATGYDVALSAAHTLAAHLGPHYFVLTIAPTGSMEPLINSRSIVIMERTDGSDIRPGQIVSFYHSPELPNVFHQVSSAINETAFIPNGVANSRYDGWQPRSAIKGRLVATLYATP